MTATLQVPAFDHGYNRRPISAIIEDRVVTFETLEEKFEALAAVWRRFTRGKSVINYGHYAYLQIVALGCAAIPFLIQRIANGDGTWYVALQYIVGEMAESADSRGDPSAVRNAWLEWGQRNGYGTKSDQAPRND